MVVTIEYLIGALNESELRRKGEKYMKHYKDSVLEYPGYEDDSILDTYEQFTTDLGVMIRDRDVFGTDYIKITAQNVGWQRRCAVKAITVDREYHDELLGRTILSECGLSDDNHIRIYRLMPRSRGILIRATNHDNPVNGDRFYLTPCVERTFNRLR